MSQIKGFAFDVNNFRHLENVHCCINKAKKRNREVGKSVMEVLDSYPCPSLSFVMGGDRINLSGPNAAAHEHRGFRSLFSPTMTRARVLWTPVIGHPASFQGQAGRIVYTYHDQRP